MGSAWQSPKGPFREALERKGMPPHRLFLQDTDGEGSKVTLEVPGRLPTASLSGPTTSWLVSFRPVTG